MEATYDREADALSITLLPDVPRARTQQVRRGILAHYDGKDRLIELEVLGASDMYAPAVLERMASPAELLTIAEAAKESGLNPSTLRKQIGNKKLKATQKGRDLFVTRADLFTYLDNRAPSGRPARRKKARRRTMDERAKAALEASNLIARMEAAQRPSKKQTA